MFRGIDDVYNAVAPLLAEHGLCIIPRFLTRTCDERQSKAGGALFYVTVEAEFDFVSAEDGSKHTARTFGEAMDSGDKGTNKAMSAAYKYAAFQTFAIPTEGNPDADSETHAVVTKERAAKATKTGAPVNHKASGPELIWNELQPDDQLYCRKVAGRVVEMMPDASRAVDILDNEGMNNDQKVGVWYLLDSGTRSAIKKAQAAQKADFTGGLEHNQSNAKD
jgi:hypothetical protein